LSHNRKEEQKQPAKLREPKRASLSPDSKFQVSACFGRLENNQDPGQPSSNIKSRVEGFFKLKDF
jgi:hypothetical protein